MSEFKTQAAPVWSANARQRLRGVPEYLRQMVRKRAEAYVSELGEGRVTCRHLSELSAARFSSAEMIRFVSARMPAPRSMTEKT